MLSHYNGNRLSSDLSAHQAAQGLKIGTEDADDKATFRPCGMFTPGVLLLLVLWAPATCEGLLVFG